MVLIDRLSGNHITVWSPTTVRDVVILLGLVFIITPGSALTLLYTDGDIHVSWRVPNSRDRPESSSNDKGKGQSVDNNNIPPRIPENVEFCEFGKYGSEVTMPGVVVIRMDTDTVIDFIKACEQLIHVTDARKKTNQSQRRRKRDVQIIYPGTKWCGTGDRADNDNDLGRFDDVDKCCREHDHCPEYIPDGEKRGGLRNDRGYTLLSCTCDEKFRKCLYGINNFNSNTVGFTYFNLLGNECYARDPNSPKGQERLKLYDSEPYVPCFRSGFFRKIFDDRDC